MKFDFIIRNGQVADGSGSGVFPADIGIRSGRIEGLGMLPGGWSQDELDAG